MHVPFLDLKAHHEPLLPEINRAMAEVIAASAFAGGPYVEKFEQQFAQFCDAQHGIGVASGTDALWFALLALGVKPGDDVLTVPSTFMATAEAITYCGARPVFVDIDPQTYTMDPQWLSRALTPRTKAIIPVHLFGQTADMNPIVEFARAKGLPIVEDACQAHGAKDHGRVAGSIGEAGCFSFYPGKNLGAFGEAGAVVTNNRELRDLIQTYRDHGQVRKYEHTVVGWNGRMDGIQGAILSVKLPRLAESNRRRREHAELYHSLLRSVPGLALPEEAPGRSHVYHLYPIRVRRRDELKQALQDRGIGTGIHYPIPVHLQKAYAHLSLERGSFPVAERCAEEFLSLPMFPELTEAQVRFVSQEVRQWCEANAGGVGRDSNLVAGKH